MLFRRGYNFEFPWVLIFLGAVIRVYFRLRKNNHGNDRYVAIDSYIRSYIAIYVAVYVTI